MPVEWNGEQAKREIEEAAGQILLRIAVTVQAAFQARISTPNPPPYRNSSQPGEYLRLRTGHARAGVVYEPATAAEVGRLGSVRVGHTENTWYARYWGARTDAQRRKSLDDCIEEIRGQLGAVAVPGLP